MEGYNLAIIGKSGVGKSSLLNYLFDKELALTGSGKPVTSQGFHFFRNLIEGKTVNIYDSWGIEAGKTEEWTRDLEQFLNQRRSPNFKDWIHTVVFCLSAEGKRIEDFEKEIFNKIKSEHLNPIIVITKSDLDPDKIFYKAVKSEFKTSQIIEICSVTQQFGLGSKRKVSNRSGNEELIKGIILNSTKSFKERFGLIRDEFVLSRKSKSLNLIMPKVNSLIDSLSHKSNFIGNFGKDEVTNILAKTESYVKEYDNETKLKLQKLVNDANEFYSNQFLFFIKETKADTFDQEVISKNKQLINQYSKLAGASVLTGITTIASVSLFSILSPISLIVGLFLLNKGISKEDLREDIEKRVLKHYDPR